MLAYYVQWHMLQAWAPLTFADEVDNPAERRENPVAPAKRSKPALEKAARRRLADGSPVMSFKRLLANMSTIVRSTLQPAGARPGEATFTLTTRPTPNQQKALDLLKTITV
jgi:hypothetical protein